MAALVLKSWKVDRQPIDKANNYVWITGRKEGVIAWILTLLRVDATTSIKVGTERIEFVATSLSGRDHRMIPLGAVSATLYGYHKPWKQATALLFTLVALTVSLCQSLIEIGDRDMYYPILLGGIAVSCLVGLLYYFLNRTLILGFVEHSGFQSMIRFKRSVIENVDVNESQARFACQMAQWLIDLRGRHAAPVATE